jgi:hypothetical protein
MWKNIVYPGRPQMAIWPMHIACWIPESKDTHSEYLILIDFPLQQWLHEHTSVLHYTGIACLAVCTEAWNRKHMQIIQAFWGCTYRSLECYSRNLTRWTLPVSQNSLYTNNFSISNIQGCITVINITLTYIYPPEWEVTNPLFLLIVTRAIGAVVPAIHHLCSSHGREIHFTNSTHCCILAVTISKLLSLGLIS